MFPIDEDNLISTAAEALALASTLRADLEAAWRRPGHVDMFDLDGRMAGSRLFQSRTLAVLRLLLDEVEAGVRSETADVVTWVPVRYVDGVEEVGAVTIARRTSHGDMLAHLAARLRTLVALIERTEALLAAEQALTGRRFGHQLRRPSE
jgi:hypothetical protein